MEIFLGVIVAAVIVLIAYYKGSLSLSGVIAAMILGTGIYLFGGVVPFVIMLAFFVSSSLLSKISKNKKEFLDNIHEKSDRRDYMQVIANGGVALLFLIIYKFTKDNSFFIASIVSFAVSNSDTWASEIGVLGKGKTYSIINGKKIEKGMSGGVSVLGTTAAFAGAAFIGITFIFISIFSSHNLLKDIQVGIIITVFGFCGSIIDSILGSTVQAQYYDEILDCVTEKSKSKNNKNRKVKGISFVNNDVVNIASNLIITAVAIFI